MAKPPRLKVFRTAIGFHDAYVATATKKAALAAWGAKKDLFARGAAEQVSDAALMEAPLAAPGTIVKVSRGTTAEQIAALPVDTPKRRRKPAPDTISPQTKKQIRPAAKPSRKALDAAEQAVAEIEQTHAARLHELAVREAALAKERRALLAEQSEAMAKLTDARDEERGAYELAVRDWRG